MKLELLSVCDALAVEQINTSADLSESCLDAILKLVPQEQEGAIQALLQGYAHWKHEELKARDDLSEKFSDTEIECLCCCVRSRDSKEGQGNV